MNCLFELAKLEMSNSGKKLKNGEEAMSNEVFQIIEHALINLRMTTPTNVTSDTYIHLDWLCSKCTVGNSSRTYLSRTIGMLQEHCGTHPGILLHVLQTLDKTPTQAKAARVLGDTLVGSYTQHFIERLHECSHSAYGNVINEMRCAQLHCKQYVQGGDELFEERVISKVRDVHSGKKKLLRMLDGEFGQKPSTNSQLQPGPSKAK